MPYYVLIFEGDEIAGFIPYAGLSEATLSYESMLAHHGHLGSVRFEVVKVVE